MFESKDSPVFPEIPAAINKLTEQIIGAAMEVHDNLGPGLIEGVYGAALEYELGRRKLRVDREFPIGIRYKDIVIKNQRLDFLVEGLVIVELKSVERFAPIHEAQLLSYLKAANLRVGLLINFNVRRLKDGVKRIVN